MMVGHAGETGVGEAEAELFVQERRHPRQEADIDKHHAAEGDHKEDHRRPAKHGEYLPQRWRRRSHTNGRAASRAQSEAYQDGEHDATKAEHPEGGTPAEPIGDETGDQPADDNAHVERGLLNGQRPSPGFGVVLGDERIGGRRIERLAPPRLRCCAPRRGSRSSRRIRSAACSDSIQTDST